METQVQGITLHYEEHGQGLAIVFVHAFPLNSQMWNPQISALAPDFRLIIPDLRGFGTSEVPAGPYTMEIFADDLAALLDQLEISQAVICGLSMGGYIAFAFLRRHAERVRALVLADTRATADIEPARVTREANAQLAETHGARAIADQMLVSLLTTDASQELRAHVRSIIEHNNPNGIAGALRGMALRSDSTELFSQIKVPTLLLVGDQDSLTPPSEMQSMREAIAHSDMIVIPGAGHISNLENPTAFNVALRDFLRRL